MSLLPTGAAHKALSRSWERRQSTHTQRDPRKWIVKVAGAEVTLWHLRSEQLAAEVTDDSNTDLVTLTSLVGVERE